MNRIVKLHILAKVNVAGAIPMVVSVNTFSSECICLHAEYRTWKLGRVNFELRKEGIDAYEKALLSNVKETLKQEGHSWAIPFFTGEVKIPHRGR